MADPLGVNLDLCLRCKTRVGADHAGLYCQACLDAEDYEEDDSLRCPLCLKVETEDLFEKVEYEEGCWERTCPSCGETYEVETNVSYSFRCPPKGKKDPD